MPPTPYPLYWPDTLPHTEFPSAKTRGLTLAKAAREVHKVFVTPSSPLYAASGKGTYPFTISTNVPLTPNNRPDKRWKTLMKGKSHGAAVYFYDPRSAFQYVVACDKFANVADNLLACARQLQGLCLMLKNAHFAVWHKLMAAFLWGPETAEAAKKRREDEAKKAAEEKAEWMKNEAWTRKAEAERERNRREWEQAEQRRRQAEQQRQEEARRGRDKAEEDETDWKSEWDRMFGGRAYSHRYTPGGSTAGSGTKPPPQPPPPQPTKNNYRHWSDVLGVPRTCTTTDAEKAYRTLARKHHPDRNIGDEGAEARFKDVQNAYDQFKRERNVK